MSIRVHLDHPTMDVFLNLQRAPKYLRFVHSRSRCGRAVVWDALDQLTDSAEPGETIVAAFQRSTGTVHIDCVENGRRVGKWLKSAAYAPFALQPPDEILRDTEKWREWCLRREAENKKNKEVENAGAEPEAR